MRHRILLSLVVASITFSSVLAHAVTFTGHVDTDFTGAMCIADPGADDSYFFHDKIFQQTGFDISELCVVAESGILKFGLLTQTNAGNNIITGDADNNGDPSNLKPGLSGTDAEDFGVYEYFSVVLDFDFNPNTGFSVVIGKNNSQTLADFGVYAAKSTNLADAKMPAMYDAAKIPATTPDSKVFASPSITQPHLEFSAAGMTTLADFTTNIDLTDPNDVMGLYFITGSDDFSSLPDLLPGAFSSTTYYGMYPLTVAHLLQIDSDGDGIIDDLDLDDDNDGISDIIEMGLKSCDLNGDGVLSVSQDRSPFDNKFTAGEEGEILKCTAGGFNANAAIPAKDWVRKAAFPGGNYPDYDGDGIPNYLDTDSDNDGIPDKDEDKNGNGIVDPGETDPYNPDTDGDGISDFDELQKFKIDTDGDGLSDGEEIETYKTDPENPDTDADGLSDGDEVKLHGTDPLNPDTDGGGARDGLEIQRGTNPLDPSDDQQALADPTLPEPPFTGPQTTVGPGEVDAGTLDPDLAGYSTTEVQVSGSGLTSCSLNQVHSEATPLVYVLLVISLMIPLSLRERARACPRGFRRGVRGKHSEGPLSPTLPQRGRGIIAVTLLLTLCISIPAHALNAQRQRLPMNGNGGIFQDNSQMLGQFNWNVQVGIDYTKKPLSVSLISSGATVDNIVDYFLTQDTSIAFGVADWLDVAVAFQSNIPSKVEPFGSTAATTQSNFGDVLISTKFLLMDPVEQKYGIGLAVIPFVTLPTGNSGRYLGANTLAGGFKLVGEHYFGRTNVYITLGADFFERENFLNMIAANEFLFGFGAQHPLSTQHDLMIMGEFDGSTTFRKFMHQQVTSPVEMNGGFRKYWFNRQLAATVSVGAGLDSGYGAPQVRAMGALSWFSHGVKDRDEDHVLDPGDYCPTQIMDPEHPGPKPGCPDPKLIVKIVGDRILILRPINFDTGAATITVDSTIVVDQIATLLKNSPELKKILVEGHTDNVGGAAYNLNLSEARAKAIVTALVARGVEANRLESRGWGLGKPLTTNAIESGRAKNRRVEFHIIEFKK